VAVLLADALQVVARGSRRLGLAEARRWICARDRDDPYSFERACETLGLPAAALRRRIGLRAEMARRSRGRSTLRGPNC
jgi:hypothetical protein